MKLSNSLLDSFIAQAQPGLRGFIRRNLFRMRQFYEVYRHEEKVSALLTQLPWTQNLKPGTRGFAVRKQR